MHATAVCVIHRWLEEWNKRAIKQHIISLRELRFWCVNHLPYVAVRTYVRSC